MSKLIVLGSSSAVPTEKHENTHLGLVGARGQILIDCVGSELVRLQRANMDPLQITDIILTHFHPDHVSGLPSLLMSMWLLGRRESLNIHGLSFTVDRAEQLMALFEMDDWPNFFSIEFYPFPQEKMTLVLENPDFRISASPVKHLLPTCGLRIESAQTGTVMAYSCDTEPCPEVVELANDAHILIHEASGPFNGHSTAAQAGAVAQAASARALYLIHYPPDLFGSQEMLNAAQKYFQGEVAFAEDFMELSF